MLVYVHIPFCHRICPYCSFYKHTPGATPIAAFVDALGREAARRIPESKGKPRTLYLGGGTPSMLSPAHLRRLFEGLGRWIDLSTLDECTLEANPATFDADKARLFRDLGVTRVSLGIQSFSPATLQTLGREHSPDEAAASVEILRAAGMPEINIDLMFSIPGLDRQAWRETLHRTIELAPEHVSAYNLTYEEDTAFLESLRRGEMDADEDRDAEDFHLSLEMLGAAGYEHYETSNHARPGHRSRHNQGYWAGEDYLGLGPSAVSTLNKQRSRNVADTAAYVARITRHGHALDECETLDDESRRIERIALGLRTREGIPAGLLDAAGRQRAAALVADGLAIWQDDRLALQGRGRALVDAVAAELI